MSCSEDIRETGDQVSSQELGPRFCSGCEQEISEARLCAMPCASMCVECTKLCGDVIHTKRFDEPVGVDGEEIVGTYYRTPNQYLALVV